MPDITLASPLLLCLLVVIVGATSSLLPFSPAEPWLLGLAAIAPAPLILPLIVLVTISTMSTKTIVFLGGRRVEALFRGKALQRFEQARARIAGKPRLQRGTLFVSSVFGLPSFYLTTVVCGTLRMPLAQYLLLGSIGRAIRFGALMILPQLFRPAVAEAQSQPQPVRVAGSGGRTYVLLSGMVGGVAGYMRLEARLVGAGNRVVSIDPYQLAIDSNEVSFHALARLVEAELARLGVDSATVIGHAHGGGVAVRLAANAPKRVRELVLLDVGALPVNRTAVFSSSIRLVPVIARIPTGKAFIRHRMVNGLRENSAVTTWLDHATCHAYTAPFLENVDRIVALAMRFAKANEPERVERVVERITAPVTILVGEVRTKAGPTPTEFAAFELNGRRARVDTVRGAGHFPHEEAPDDVAKLLLRPRQVIAVVDRAERP